MTEIERKALALLQDCGFHGGYIDRKWNEQYEALCRAILDETGVLLCHGDCFDVPSTFRLGYSFDEGETLTKGLQALGDFFSRKDRTGW